MTTPGERMAAEVVRESINALEARLAGGAEVNGTGVRSITVHVHEWRVYTGGVYCDCGHELKVIR